MEMITPQDLFNEIQAYHQADIPLSTRYVRLQSLLRRVAMERSAPLSSDYSGLFPRLYAVCEYYGVELREIDRFRAHAYRFSHGDFIPTPRTYLYDLRALCQFVSAIYKISIPERLAVLLPKDLVHSNVSVAVKAPQKKRMRLVVTTVDETFFYGYDVEQESTKEPCRVCYGGKEGAFSALPTQLRKGCQVNLLSVTFNKGTYYPSHIVLEPDFLLDVSALSACMKPYGSTALNYVVNKFMPRSNTAAILLGNAANQFMDDCINTPEELLKSCTSKELFLQSMQTHFHNALIEYVACDKINKEYFDHAQIQFRHIQEAVLTSFGHSDIGIARDQVQLEPSFICEALGLRGRFDVMTTDCKRIVELKSGKADSWGNEMRLKPEHALQMALYKEILYYNRGVARDDIKSFLFYSRYPLFYDERTSKRQIQGAMALRNAIVAMELRLKEDGIRTMLPEITMNAINEKQMDDRFFHTYLRPALEMFVKPLHSATSLEMAYFDRFVRFIEKEQFLSKIGDCRLDSNRGFANVWTQSVETKLSTGDILLNLELQHITDGMVEQLCFRLISYDSDVLPNFRIGDMAQLYECTSFADNVTTRQVFRGVIEEWKDDQIVFRLQYRQRCAKVFNVGGTYAIEHDSMDSSFTQAYRGLFSFLTAPIYRRNLLLGAQPPTFTKSRTLVGTYLNPEIDRIVLRAKQANDYFLLIGPPGTGKTSVALRSMVEEFLISRKGDDTILLLAYTNRAVDEICEMLEELESARMVYVRIGNELSCGARYRSHLLNNVFSSVKNRQEAKDQLAICPIVVSTISSLCGRQELFDVKHFSVAIVDEASQVLEPHLLPLLCAHRNGVSSIDKFVFVGDPNQLPAVVMQREEESNVTDVSLREIGLTNCRNSLFERLQMLCTRFAEKMPIAPVAMLHCQGRMHTDICDFVNTHFYEGQIKPVPLEHQIGETSFKLFEKGWEQFVATSRIGFMDIGYPQKKTDNNKINLAEADAIAHLVGTLFKLCKKNNVTFLKDYSVGIIVPFRGQISQVRKALKSLPFKSESILIDTVECFQGSQRDFVIFGTTISMPYQLETLSSEQLVGNTKVDRKFNVAITRARKQFFLVGNSALLCRLPLYAEYIAQAVKASY
ncbi:MAG: ATP-dependent helicase [Bacteroidaceae bacterium]